MLKQPISELKEMSVEEDATTSIEHFKRIFGLSETDVTVIEKNKPKRGVNG